MRWKVYRTDLDDGRFYFGMSGKVGKEWDKYFGSSTIVKNHHGKMKKVVLYEYHKKSHAKYRELLLQLEYLNDDDCINDMIHVRLRMKYLKDFQVETEEPTPSVDCSEIA